MSAWLQIVITIGSTAAVASFVMMMTIRDRSLKNHEALYGDGQLVKKVDQLMIWKAQEDILDAYEEAERREIGRRPERIRDKLHGGNS